MSRSRVARAFTLVDLAVVLAVLGVMLAVGLPMMRRCRGAGQEQRDQLAAKLWARAFASYSIDNADGVVPAASNWAWTHPFPPPVGWAGTAMWPDDPVESGRRVSAGAARVYTFQMISGRGVPREAIQSDATTLTDFMARSHQGGLDHQPNVYDYPDTTAQAALACHPTFGYNGVFVGGSYRHGAWQDPYGVTNAPNGFFYVRRTAEIATPSRLLAFVSARGGDVANSTYWNWVSQYPNTHTMRPGYWLVTPPRVGAISGAGALANWAASNTYSNTFIAQTWGNVRADQGNSKALVIACDGHNETLSLEALRDMRRWANQATSATWQWSGEPAVAPKP